MIRYFAVAWIGVLGTLLHVTPVVRAQTVATDPLTDEVLQTLGVKRTTIAQDEPTRSALTDGVRQFLAGDGDAAWQSFHAASDRDTTLPDGTALLARMMAQQNSTGGKAPTFAAEQVDKLLPLLEQRSNKTYAKSQDADGDDRRTVLQESLTYARSLAALKPEDHTYRFNAGYILQELGDIKSAQKIMDELAPRDSRGFAKAHLWQADQLLSPDRPLTPENLDAAEAHLLHALATYSEPNEIHRRLGELYYYRYVRSNPRQPGANAAERAVFLDKAAEHLAKVNDADVKLQLTLAEIRGLQGKTKEAEAEVDRVIDRLTKRLVAVPDDVEARLSLARAYRMVRRFADAVKVLREGIVFRQDVRLIQELSSVYYYMAMDVRQHRPQALAEQFAALQDAYRAYPTHNYVTHRFFQALSSSGPEEAAAARDALQKLVDTDAPGLVAPLLLAFDERRQGRPEDADKRLATIRAAKPDGTPAVIAGLAMAVLGGQIKSLNPSAASSLFDTSLDVWPDDPDLLSVKAQQHLLLRQYTLALDALQKALKQRSDDVKLNEMIAVTYERLGQTENAREHQKRAAELRAKQTASPTK
jgi:predicted Zn-dependent protease